MPLIEGIGDEVLQFVAILWIIAVGAIAWWSTNARPERYRTIVVMRSRTHHPVTVSIRTGPDVLLSNFPVNNTAQSSMAATSGALSENREESQMIPLREMDSIVDADMAMIDHNRLHFYRRMDLETSNDQTSTEPNAETESQEESSEPASNAQIREMDSIVSAMEADVTTTVGSQSQDQNTTSSTPESKDKIDGQKKDNAATSNVNNTASVNTDGPSTDENIGADNSKKILIKLKYLNDTLREVDGNLDELLKDFKWRHFSAELSSESRVRLIFNGHVLIDDRATLRACGLYDRAVVHCLVHPKRANNQQGSSAGLGGAGVGLGGGVAGAGAQGGAEAPVDRVWDLENILMTLVSIALTVVWFFRCEYSNMFTASASVALFGLTVFYSVAIFGLYLSDTFHFDRRQPAAAPPPPPAPAPPPPPPQPQPQPTN